MLRVDSLSLTYCTVLYEPRRREGLMVSALDSGDIVLCHWTKRFTLIVPIFTQVYKWVMANIILGLTL